MESYCEEEVVLPTTTTIMTLLSDFNPPLLEDQDDISVDNEVSLADVLDFPSLLNFEQGSLHEPLTSIYNDYRIPTSLEEWPLISSSSFQPFEIQNTCRNNASFPYRVKSTFEVFGTDSNYPPPM